MDLFHGWRVHSQAKGIDHCQKTLVKWILLYFLRCNLWDSFSLWCSVYFSQSQTTATLPACQRASLYYFLHHSLCGCVIMCRLMRCPLTRCQSAAVPEARLRGRGEADGRGIRGGEKPTANGKHTSLRRSNGSFFCGGAGWQASRSEARFKNRGSATPLLGATLHLTEILGVMRRGATEEKKGSV